MKAIIGIYIGALQKGTMMSLAKEIESRGDGFVFILKDSNVEAVVRKGFPSLSSDKIIVLDKLDCDLPKNITQECVLREERYDVTISTLMSFDRGLGKGYLLNAPGHPNIIKSWFSKKDKYAFFLKDMLIWESLIDNVKLNTIIGMAIPVIAEVVLKARDVKIYVLTPPRFGSLYRWTINYREESPALTRSIMAHVASLSELEEVAPAHTKLEKSKFSEYFFNKLNYGYRSAIIDFLKRIFIESIQYLKGNHDRFGKGYSFLGWNGVILRVPYIYNYLCKKGKKPSDLDDSKVLLFPLQMEPEASLMKITPELSNSAEVITWISKCLPADYCLVVKEQPTAFGIRNKKYYDNFLRMSNVVIAHPDVSVDEWLDKSTIVSSLTSSMAFEAVIKNKPVLSFGKHQVINHLPSVVYCDNFNSTKLALSKVFKMLETDSNIFHISNIALNKGFNDVCFDISGYEKKFESINIDMDMAKKSIDNLADNYPEYND
jgi:hypothetical protein